jgi:hypothetical protein
MLQTGRERQMFVGRRTLVRMSESDEPMPDPSAVAVGKELLPAIKEFTEAVGRTAPGQEMLAWFGDIVRYRRLEHQAKLLRRAAEKIRRIGIPTAAVDDRLLRAVLEDGGFEDDASMQERWANLLASAAFGTPVPPALPEILRQLEPVEAQLLDRLVELRAPLLHGKKTYIEALDPPAELQWRHLDNLERLQLANWVWQGPVNVPLPPTPSEAPELDLELFETQLGRHLVGACKGPASDPQDPPDSSTR